MVYLKINFEPSWGRVSVSRFLEFAYLLQVSAIEAFAFLEPEGFVAVKYFMRNMPDDLNTDLRDQWSLLVLYQHVATIFMYFGDIWTTKQFSFYENKDTEYLCMCEA